MLFRSVLFSTNVKDPAPYRFPVIGREAYYTVKLVAYNAGIGCSDSTRHTLTVLDHCLIAVPTGFTPNNDGLNDVFFPTGTGIDSENYELSIYDRWGSKIWSTNDFLKGRDGKVEGGSEVEQQDVYVWRIYLKKFDGTKKNDTGHITVIR